MEEFGISELCFGGQFWQEYEEWIGGGKEMKIKSSQQEALAVSR